MNIQELKTLLAEKRYIVIKYVKVKDEFRFADLINGPQHKDMLEKDEIAQSAGYFYIDLDSKYIEAKGESMSLCLGPEKDDSEKLALIFGVIYD